MTNTEKEKEEVKQTETEPETVAEAVEIDFSSLETSIKANSDNLTNINNKLEAMETTLNNLAENLNKPKKVIIKNSENKSPQMTLREQHQKAMKNLFGPHGNGR